MKRSVRLVQRAEAAREGRMIGSGRFSATPEMPLLLLLIGVRINRLMAVHKWLPVLRG